MRGVYRTAQGKIVNMDNLRLQHEKEKAVGNMGVNARGDQVDQHGNIIRGRNQVVNDHYHNIDRAVKQSKKPRG